MFAALIAKLGLDALFGGVGRFISSAFAWVTSSVAHIFIVTTVVFGASALWERHEASANYSLYQIEKIGRASDRAGYVAAQATASRNAQNQQAFYEGKLQENANAAQVNEDSLRAAGNSRLAAYLSTHGLRGGSATAQGAAGSMPATGQVAGSTVSASAPSGSVVASVSDITVCNALYDYALGAFHFIQDSASTLDGTKKAPAPAPSQGQ